FLKMLPRDGLASEFREAVERIPSRDCGIFKVVLALDGLPRFTIAQSDEEAERFAACQFRIAPSVDYLELAYDDAKYGRWPSGPMIWGLTPSVSDPTMAPPGKHL